MKLTKRTKVIALTTIAIIIILFAGTSCFMGYLVFTGSTQLVSNEDTSDVSDSFWEKYGINYEEFCQNFLIEKMEITSSFDGHIIPADYIYAQCSNGNKNHKTVVLVHGLGGNRYTNYPVAAMFLEYGYNVVTFDQRSSGENTAKYTTFGYWEKYDLADCIDYVRKNAKGQIVGVWGTSFGGATAGLAVGEEDIEKQVDFLILDCPVSSMQWMVEEEMKKMDMGILVSYMVWCGNFINEIKLGFGYQDAEVSKAMSGTKLPVLIINSRADEVTPYFMGQSIYDGIHGENKQLWTVKDSGHAEIWLDYNQEYRNKVAALLLNLEQ